MPPISSASEELDNNGPIIADFNTRDTDLGYFDCHFPIAQGYRGRCAVTRNTLEGSRVLPDPSELRPRISP